MSFGWSVGDIAAAVKLLYKVINALDDADGAADNYRESVGFLRDLMRTIHALSTLPSLNTYPSYTDEIEQQVNFIKEPVEHFIATVRKKYEASLGETTLRGHHRHVYKKLQWHFAKENEVLVLRDKISRHMRIIDSLVSRLTL